MAFLKEGITHIKSVIDCQAAIEAGEVVRVEQAHKDEVNVNNIVKRHGIDLIQKVAALQTFEFDDVTTNDFQEMMNQMIKAKETFSQVPSKIRKEFDNDPAKFMDYVHASANNEEYKQQLREWGLAKMPEPAPAPIEVIVTNPETPPAE